MGCHVLDVWSQKLLAEERMLRMAGERLDEIFLVDGGVEGLNQELAEEF